MPAVKPVMTAVDTNDITEPRRSTPSSTIHSPTTSVSAATAPRSPGSRPASVRMLCAESAMALVRVVTMRTVREKTDPTMVGTAPDHRPRGAENPPTVA